MTIEVFDDAQAVARHAAHWIASQARRAFADRGRFVLGVSGGSTPWLMLRELASEDVNWSAMDIVQVDERVAPEDHAERNLRSLRESLRAAPLAAGRIHAMPVQSSSLSAGADQYAATLAALAGSPPTLDVVHLGLGEDGHTASLTPGDPSLDVTDRDVTVTGAYRGRRRMTLTYPILNRARRILWIVTGSQKAEALDRLRKGDRAIPAGRIRREAALVLADRAAAGE